MTERFDVRRELENLPWWAKLLLIRPRHVAKNLTMVHEAGIVGVAPNLWQLTLGVLRMWHRVIFRFNTIGTCAKHAVRDTWRAKLLRWRPARFFPLLWEGAISPWDMSGLLSSRERMIRHLLGAHHDGDQFVYDLRILQCYPGALEEARDRAAKVVTEDTRYHTWLRDICVYERYHESLLNSLDRALQGDFSVSDKDADNADITFDAWLGWCARQPATPAGTWRMLRNGDYSFGDGARTLAVEA